MRWNAGPACKRSNRDKYEPLSGYFDYKFPITVDDNASLSISDCMDRCWKNCSSVGIDSRGENYANYTGCILFHGSSLVLESLVSIIIFMILMNSKLKLFISIWAEKFLHELMTMDIINKWHIWAWEWWKQRSQFKSI